MTEPKIPDHLQALIPALPDFFAAVLARLDAQDGWNPFAVHPSDLGAVLPDDGSGPHGCARRVYLRTHGFQGRPKTPGQMLLLETAKDRHVTLETLLGNYRVLLAEMFPGWELAGVEESAGEEGEEGTLDILLRCSTSCPSCGGGGSHLLFNIEDLPEEELECTKCAATGAVSILLVVDVKTMNGSGFAFLRKEGQAKPAHKLQVQKYMRAKEADMGVVLYVDREGSAFMWQSPVFGRDDALVGRLWAELEERCGPRAETPPPSLAPAMKRDGPTLPWLCQYHDKTGAAIQCPYLDTPHCPGALPPDKRPAHKQIWTSRTVPAGGSK